jgi:hypothetical protein
MKANLEIFKRTTKNAINRPREGCNTVSTRF